MGFETLNPAATKKRIDSDEGWIFLDVRTVEEFDDGHAPDAYNIPFAFRDPMAGMTPNPEFIQIVKNNFGPDTRLVLG